MNHMKLYTGKDLKTFRDRVNSGETNLRAELMNDIDITPSEINGCILNWDPIGNSYEYGYSGIFDGRGHTVSGLYIKEQRRPSGKRSGLFGFNKGQIKNLTVDGFIDAQSATGGICGENIGTGVEHIDAFSGSILRCVNKCKIRGEYYTGGIVGDNQWGIIRDCINYGEIHDATNLGGIVGGSDGNMVIGCKNFGSLFIDSQNVYGYDPYRKNNYRYNQIGNLEQTDSSNLQNGKVIVPFQNTIPGMFFRYNGLLNVEMLKDLIKHDPEPEHLNQDGNTYLHLLCQNMHAEMRPEQAMQLIAFLATETNIDFEAMNNNGKTASSFLKNRKIKNLIKYIIKEKNHADTNRKDDDFCTIGF